MNFYTIVVLLCSNLAFSLNLYAKEQHVGYQTYEISANHREKPLRVAIWYPVEKESSLQNNTDVLIGDSVIFYGQQVKSAENIQAGKHPLIVFSHGSGGNVETFAWYAKALAKNNYIVVGVNHQGSTTGDASPKQSIKLWQRSQDIKSLIDDLETNAIFSDFIDRQNITALGFSLGGQTVLSLLGAKIDVEQYLKYCDEKPQRADCRYFLSQGDSLEDVPAEQLGRGFIDERVKQAIAIDPGFSQVFDDRSVEDINKPVLFINLGEDKDLWEATNTQKIHGQIKQSQRVNIKESHHFSFLPLCKPKASQILLEEKEDPICDDIGPKTRAQVHKEVLAIILNFTGE